MKLSIITINKNNALGLRRTIKSVVNQSSIDFEYIIIDGASTDGSVDVIKEFEFKIKELKPPNFRFTWISESDNGIYNAMNKGILKASGEYLQFLNSGDYLASDEVTERMLNSMPSGKIIYGNKIKLLKNGKEYYNRKIETDSFLTFYKGTLNHACAYIHSSLFNKYGLYDENLKIVSDWKFYLQTIALNNESVSYVDINVVYYDMTGISAVNKELDIKERKMVLEELVPENILKDYDKYAGSILKQNRLSRYKITNGLVWILDRIIFQIEKRRNS